MALGQPAMNTSLIQIPQLLSALLFNLINPFYQLELFTMNGGSLCQLVYGSEVGRPVLHAMALVVPIQNTVRDVYTVVELQSLYSFSE